MEFSPQPAWTPLGKEKAAANSALANIWSLETAFLNLASSITCIKRLGRNFHDAASTNSSVQQALYPEIVASIMHIYIVVTLLQAFQILHFIFCTITVLPGNFT
jgi:hypothetical protein